MLQQLHARVTTAGRVEIAFFERNQIIEGCHERKLLREQDLDPVLIEFEQVIGCVDAGVDAAGHAFAAVSVARDLKAEPVRFVDDCLNLLERQRWGIHQRRVGCPHVHGAGEILRGVDFHAVDAVQLRFAHCGAREPRAVDVLIFDEAFLKAAPTYPDSNWSRED